MVTAPGDQSAAVAPITGRRLTAVVYADMVGYSRLIGSDDAGTFARLQELRRDLIDPAVARHGGTLVNTAGDSLLLTFDSIISAMRFVVEVQRGIPDFDGDYPPDRRVRFRMGVNVGDVIPDGTNMHGEGVNIAARLQTVCPPGGVCVSRVVRDHVGNRLGLGFKELGAIDLKNIGHPVEAFLLDLDAQPPALARNPRPRRSRRTLALAGAAAVCVVGLAALALSAAGIRLLPPGTAPPTHENPLQTADSSVPPLSIAVLPFLNLSDDPAQAYLADGISEDLTTDLAHLDNAFVISRESAFSYRGKSVDIREIGRQLGVRYLLEGSVRKIDKTLRINAQLIAAETGGHVWAERFDKPIADLGEGQDDIVAQIGSALDVRLVNLASARQTRSQSGTPAAFDLVLRARSVLLESRSTERNLIALGLLLQALRTDPNSVPAMANVAALFAGSFYSRNEIKRAEDLVTNAERRAPDSPDVLVAKFLLMQRERRTKDALAIYRRLLDVDASATGVILQLGLDRTWSIEPEAIPLLQKTIRVNPRSTALGEVRTELATALLRAGRPEEARAELLDTLAHVPAGSSSVLSSPSSSEQEDDGNSWANWTRVYLAIADVRTGRLDEAEGIIKDVLKAPAMRGLSVRSYLRGLREFDDADYIAVYRGFGEDLRRAGLRDHLDEDLDDGTPSTSELQDFGKLNTLTPTSIPGGRTVRTPEVIEMLATRQPVVVTTTNDVPTIPGTIYIDAPATGNVRDGLQSSLGRLMRELTQGDLHRPIIVFSYNIYRWQGRNLALRLIALGYTDVAWYRGGWDAWEASGQPRSQIVARYNPR